MSALIIDWLGRGGIAQTAEVWRDVGTDGGVDTRLLSRSGREVEPDVEFSSPIPGRISQHLAGVAKAVMTIRTLRPKTVVIHSWLIPALELPVVLAARSVGAKSVLVAHNHRSHTSETGLDIGLSRLLDKVDVIVVHSEFVRDALPQRLSKKSLLIPHPKPLGLLRDRNQRPSSAGTDLRCLQFGVGRSTKDTALISELAESDLNPWRFVMAGTMADGGAGHPSVETHPGFQSPTQLHELVRNATAVLLPYTAASQSGAVILARCLGAVPIASAVGGIPNQIDDGVDGLLIEPGIGAVAWAEALKKASDPVWRESAVAAGQRRMEHEHHQFVTAVLGLIGPEHACSGREHFGTPA